MYFKDLLLKGIDKFVIRFETFLLTIFLERVKRIHEIIFNKVFIEQSNYALVLMRDARKTRLVIRTLFLIKRRQFLSYWLWILAFSILFQIVFFHYIII